MAPLTLFLITGLLVLFGATVASLTGFGFAIAIMPFMLLLYPPTVAVPLTTLVAACGNLMQWLRIRRDIDWRLVGLLTLGAVFGLPLGSYVLIAVDPGILKALIGLGVLASAIMTLLRREDPGMPAGHPGTVVTLLTGFGSGILATSVGQPGLLTALFMARTRMEKTVVRATLVCFFLLTNAGSLTTLFYQRVFNPDLGVTGLSLAPFYWIGLALGDVGFRRSTQALHRRLSLGVLVVTSVLGVINGISALL